MARIVFSSDLHYDDEADLTPPSRVAELASGIAAVEPDALVIAGDLGHPFHNFSACLDTLVRAGVPMGIIAGNHDVWKDPSGVPGSAELFDTMLPDAARARGVAWLERDTLVVGDTAIVGSLAWYDYSAVDPSLGLSGVQLVDLKKHATNDSVWVDFPVSDPVMASRMKFRLLSRLEALEWDDSISRVVVVTHVPLFERQMRRRTDETSWTLLRAYFGNLTTGQAILPYSKVCALVSGHTHRQVIAAEIPRPGLDPLLTYVVGSDYGEPATVTLELGDSGIGEAPAEVTLRRDGPPWPE